RRSNAGFSLVEVLVASIVLVVAILGHASSVVTAHTLNQSTEERGLAMQTLGAFVERLRSDPDWAGFYARARPLSSESTTGTPSARLDTDLSLTTYSASTYYSDFVPPTSLGTVTFLVQVPSSTVGGVTALRENMSATRYGLPFDLNGDGVIDGNSRNTDY